LCINKIVCQPASNYLSPTLSTLVTPSASIPPLFLFLQKIIKMSLEIIINDDIKQAMLAKDKVKLAALRSIKAALLLEKTGAGTSGTEVPETVEIKLLQKQVKQRKEAAAIYRENGRNELAEEEEFQAAIIEKYLPEQMSMEEVEGVVKRIVEETGATSIKDMGRVMGMASKQLAGKADNKAISGIVKSLLT